MADRFWIGDTGSWTDTSHWSTSSGGGGGASVPTSSDNVFFDANSFTGSGKTVTITNTVSCLDMDWSAATNTPTLSDNYSEIRVYGSLTLNSSMNLSAGVFFRMCATTTGHTVNTNGKTIPYGIAFDGLGFGGGEWTLEGDLSAGTYIQHAHGALITSNYNIDAGETFGCNGTATRTLTLGSSTVTASNLIEFTSTGLTLNVGTSKLILTGNSATFAGGGLTFIDVEFQGTTTTVAGSNTFRYMYFTAGKKVKFTYGTNQTIQDLPNDGSAGSLITLESTSSGQKFTLTKTTGTLQVFYYSIKDSIATGGATWKANGSIDSGGNTGWTINPFVYEWITPIYNRSKNYLKYYNCTDVNRVANNSNYLAEYASLKSITVTLDAWTDQTTKDLPNYALINLLEHNINLILAEVTEPGLWITLNEDWDATNDVFDYNNANSLEWDQALLKYVLEQL